MVLKSGAGHSLGVGITQWLSKGCSCVQAGESVLSSWAATAALIVHASHGLLCRHVLSYFLVPSKCFLPFTCLFLKQELV